MRPLTLSSLLLVVLSGCASAAPHPTLSASEAAARESGPAPAGTRWVRGRGYLVAVPTAALAAGDSWHEGAAFELYALLGPLQGSLEDELRRPFAQLRLWDALRPALRSEGSGEHRWLRWSVELPPVSEPTMHTVRLLRDGARVVAAECQYNPSQRAQEALCGRILGSLRVRAAALTVTREEGSQSFAQDEVAVDMPASWHRLAERVVTAVGPTTLSPAAHRGMVLLLHIRPDATDLPQTMDALVATMATAERTQVLERRVQGSGEGAEGVLRFQSTHTRPGGLLVGRATARGGVGALLFCMAPAGTAPAQCQRSVDSFALVGP